MRHRPVAVQPLGRAFAALTGLVALSGSAGLAAELTRRRAARPAAVAALLGATVSAGLLAGVVAARTTARTARAVDALLADTRRARDAAEQATRLGARARELGARVRRHLAVQAAADEVAAGLGELLGADHAVVRLARRDGGPAPVARWSRAGATGDTGALAALGIAWLLSRGEGRTWTSADVRAGGPPAPPEERRALAAAHAGAAVTVSFDGGTGPSGAVTVVRTRGARAWRPVEVQAVESVAADLCRGLLQAQLYHREQQLAVRLRDLDNAKTDFMATASHELRTPLTSMSGYLEMLRDGDFGPLTDDQGQMLEVIERNTSRLRALIEDLLVLSHAEAGTFSAAAQETDVGWIVGGAVAAVRPAAVAAGVDLETDVDPGLRGQVDPDQLGRVLMNLLSNAVKFTPRGGKVCVSAHRDGADIVLRVADTGMGIPEDEQPNLFGRFFRASNATARAIPGTGLGLAIVRTIVAHHDGQIAVDSREGAGTTVVVRLPA